jgi:hypothetical protein
MGGFEAETNGARTPRGVAAGAWCWVRGAEIQRRGAGGIRACDGEGEAVVERGVGIFVGSEARTVDWWDVEFDAEIAELGGGEVEGEGFEEGVVLLEDWLDDAVGEVGLEESVGECLGRGEYGGRGLLAAEFAVEEEGVDVHK